MGTLFHQVLLQQNHLNVNPSGIIEQLLLPAVSSSEDTPVMGFKGEYPNPEFQPQYFFYGFIKICCNSLYFLKGFTNACP